ncbi:MAG TPA: ferritin family protein [Bacteroidales bacterium]
MIDIKESLTAINLIQALAIETQTIQKYSWFAKQAKKDGFEQMAAIFLEIAEQKKSHTKTIFRFLESISVKMNSTFAIPPIGSTLDNLRQAASSEQNEAIELYAQFEKTAWDEGFKQIATKLKLFRQIKTFYSQKFNILADNIVNDRVFRREKKVKWICRKCGLIYESERALKNCPGCEHPQAYFEILAENY